MTLFNFAKITKLIAAVFVAVSLGSMVACASKQNQESAEEYVEDSVITAKVKAAILNEPDLKVTEINVETFQGTVQLSGFVSEQGDIGKATVVARNVKGVKSVKNDIRLK